MSKQVLISGYYGFANAGDEAILAAMLAQLQDIQPGLRPVVVSGNPASTTGVHGVEAILWSDPLAISDAVLRSDLVIIGGGGLFHDYWGFAPDGLLTPGNWGLGFFVTPAVLAALYERPLMLYAVGAGPLLSEHGRKFTKAACEAASAITVRDAGSKALLESLGVPAENVTITADPAFLLHPSNGARQLPPGRPLLGVALRNWNVGVDPRFWERAVASALDFFVDSEGGSVLMVPFQHITGEHEDDSAVTQRVVSLMKHRDRTTVLGCERSPSELAGLLAQCDAVLGMRLHSLIFGVLGGVPLVALSYDPKVCELMRQIGLADYSIRLADIDPATIVDRLRQAMDSANCVRAKLAEARERCIRLAEQNAQIAAGILQRNAATPGRFPADMLPLLAFAARGLLRTNSELRVSVDRLADEHKRLEKETLRLQAEAAAAEQLRRKAGLRRKEKARREQEISSQNEELRKAEEARKAAAAGVERFRKRFAEELRLYRDQRAWKCMLFMRKAYTLLLRRGWRGRMEFAGWLLTAPFTAQNWEEYELRFPDISGYLDEALSKPLLPNPFAADGASRLPPQTGYDLIVLAIIDFDFRFQRPQQIAAQFARDGRRVFWISPTRLLPESSPRPYELIPLGENLWEVRLRGRQPDIYMGRLEAGAAGGLFDSLRELYRDCGIAESCAFVQLPFWRRLGLALRSQLDARLVYDCMDDWGTFVNMGEFNVSEEAKLVQECDVLVVTAQELLRKFQQRGLNPILARNGADFDFFRTARSNGLLADVPRPIAGYFGAIADWIDLELVCDVARLRPRYSFVLIGQVFGRDVSALKSLPNVFLLGSKGYAEIPSYLFHFDVCVIPFLLNQVTKATDPVKLYEYFSLGKPVVATELSELNQCRELLYFAKNPADFADQLDLAVKENDPDLKQRRIEFAARNTWASRVEAIERAVVPKFPLVSILIVTYNSRDFVAPCLDSIERNTSYPNYEVIVVDNDSADGTQQLLREHAADPKIRVECLPSNKGFAGATNVAADLAAGEYLVFLNVDTMVTSGWVGRLLRHSKADASIGLISPVTNYAGNEVKINISYRDYAEMESFALRLARENMGRRTEIAMAPLFCALTPREVWEQAGKLDESFQIGMFEDDDFSLRVRNAGFRIVAAEDCFVHHFGQGSFSKMSPAAYNQIFEKNRRRFEEKWNVKWTPHRTRSNVKPAYEEPRFAPHDFVRAGKTIC